MVEIHPSLCIVGFFLLTCAPILLWALARHVGIDKISVSIEEVKQDENK